MKFAKNVWDNAAKRLGSPASTKANETTGSDIKRPQGGRLQKIEGIDYKRAAVEYTKHLGPAHYHYHYTKPFYNVAEKTPERLLEGLGADAHRYFCDFANMAMMLRLEAGRRILEVGCGPGWLCEYFARLGYDVTGIDISPDLISVARERVKRIPFPVDHRTPVRCRFEVHDIEREPLPNLPIFDAIICYDSLHHFEDEHAAMRHVTAMLPSGGLLFVLEGEKPPPGSEGERQLQNVMRDFGTLESPFTREYLFRLLSEYDLRVVGDFVSVNGLFEREAVEDSRLRVAPPAVNYLLCKKSTAPHSREPQLLRAEIELEDSWRREFAPNTTARFSLIITNTGDTLWLAGAMIRKGTITLGVKLFDEMGRVVDERHNEPPLSAAVAPGEHITVPINYKTPSAPGSYTLRIDMIAQHICWFQERGSQPLVLELIVLNCVDLEKSDGAASEKGQIDAQNAG